MTTSISTISYPHLAAEYIQKTCPSFKPKVGVVLGSGLGQFAEELEDTVAIEYEKLPGFPRTTVQGHGGKLILGYYGSTAVICLQGRAHTYESMENHEAVKTYVRTLKLLGCQYFIATNASGSLKEEVGPGELMLITDHINFQPGNPLVGPNDDEFGPRFYPLDSAYDITMRNALLDIAQRHSIKLHQGVYISVLGPNYETAAEIRAFKLLGADAVGMSTVPEVLVANHCGLRVAVIATITNYATGLAKTSHSHESVVKMASSAAEKLNTLIKQYILELS
ncbi:TPA: purine-nucleoside phosphorylase [Legionella pneumophila subsp. pneumophila]|uniref:purine-nucleoside phosphorylase n=1 Tax=Legionella pneumophila TaxID=446 RepID=UPI001A1BF658|nr:purine-nucleoside phosphorylase [Legionella pneumophila subsp. pneumophila]HAT9589589.1 purine-nucleoside phosphorylase [Legionella pneumophila subsp. pneumophila]HAU0936268.1 purine-nucleoside phosphorylase [Legionella pneumophila]HCC3231560.1 purine-nucleoside phosphorylase [Legionella pneumophila subsp. pneumophila]HCW6765765.1 purine-nucleoside phosphorylase [Legionella pneumophila]